MNAPAEHAGRRWRVGRAPLVLVGFLGIGAFLLLSEHRAHLLGYLPWLLLLACPLLHHFMHGGHGSHGGHESGTSKTPVPSLKGMK